MLFILPLKLLAQEDMLTGNIFDNDNRTIPLQGATIKNLRSKTVSIADKSGHFSVGAKKGDLVTFGMVGFETDTLYVINLFPINIYLLSSVNYLKAVDIGGAKISPYLDDLGNPDNKPPTKQLDMDKNRGGLRLNLGYGKWRKNQAKVQALEDEQIIVEEINAKFNEKYVRETLKFQGTKQELKNFMDMYRPTVDQVKSKRPFNYEYHIASSYQTWSNLPPNQRKLTPLSKTKVDH